MFSLESGLVPNDMDTELQILLDNINLKEGTDYTMDEFKNSSNYVVAYMVAQRFIEMQQSTASIFDYYKSYIDIVNTKIKNPISNINGIIDYFAENGYNLSFKKNVNPMPNYTYITDLLTPIADTGGSLTSEQVLLILSNLTTIKNGAGNVWLAIERLDESTWVDEIDNPIVAKLILDVIDIGNILWGAKEESIVINNNQNLIQKWSLPTYETLKLRMSYTLSNSYTGTKLTDDELKDLIVANVKLYCKLGMDFEPERILEIDRDNLLYMSEILIEWTTAETPAPEDWSSEVKPNTYEIKEIVIKDNVTIL